MFLRPSSSSSPEPGRARPLRPRCAGLPSDRAPGPRTSSGPADLPCAGSSGLRQGARRYFASFTFPSSLPTAALSRPACPSFGHQLVSSPQSHCRMSHTVRKTGEAGHRPAPRKGKRAPRPGSRARRPPTRASRSPPASPRSLAGPPAPGPARPRPRPESPLLTAGS